MLSRRSSRGNLGCRTSSDLGAISKVISGQSRVSHLIRSADRRVAICILRLHTHLHRSVNRRRLIIHRVDADLGRRPWVEVEEKRRGWRVLHGDAGWRGFYV